MHTSGERRTSTSISSLKQIIAGQALAAVVTWFNREKIPTPHQDEVAKILYTVAQRVYERVRGKGTILGMDLAQEVAGAVTETLRQIFPSQQE